MGLRERCVAPPLVETSDLWVLSINEQRYSLLGSVFQQVIMKKAGSARAPPVFPDHQLQ